MRTEQDNNITLYSSSELEKMERILFNKTSTSYVPFTLSEIKAELLKRTQEWVKSLPKGKTWFASNSDKPLFKA